MRACTLRVPILKLKMKSQAFMLIVVSHGQFKYGRREVPFICCLHEFKQQRTFTSVIFLHRSASISSEKGALFGFIEERTGV